MREVRVRRRPSTRPPLLCWPCCLLWVSSPECSFARWARPVARLRGAYRSLSVRGSDGVPDGVIRCHRGSRVGVPGGVPLDDFTVDDAGRTVTCPDGLTRPITDSPGV